MRLVVFTANQPRHVAFVESLQKAGHDLIAIFVEPKSILKPTTPALLSHWRRMRNAELEIFGDKLLIEAPVMAVRPGEISACVQAAAFAYAADRVVVFSASWIRSPLLEAVQSRQSLNLHMGIAPSYRGSACNFWAEYDYRPELVGAQVQRLSAGLDQGEIVAERRPMILASRDPFVRGMEAVQLGIEAMVEHLTRDYDESRDTAQAPNRLMRRSDFTESVASDYLARPEVRAFA